MSEVSPELGSFYEALTQTPTDITRLRDALNTISDSEERNKALVYINKTTSLSENERIALRRELHDGLRPQVRPGTKIEEASVVIEELTEGISLISSILPEGVSQQDALELGEKEIGKPLTKEKIKGYQIENNISIDTTNVKIGPETYGEMYAAVLEKKLRNNMRDGYITTPLQGEILQLFSYANPQGINSVLLLQYVYLIQREGKEDLGNDRFEMVYGDFFEQVEAKVSTQVDSPENQAAGAAVLDTKSKSGLSVGGGIIAIAEGKMTTGEFIEEFKGIGMLVGVVAFIFFGNKIPGMENVGLLGRIGILVAGKLLGADELIGYGADKLADGVSAGNKYIRSELAQEHFEYGQNLFTQTWESLTDSETYGVGLDAANHIFGNTIEGMEGINEKFKESETGKFIEQFTGKSSAILSDASFLNATKEQVLGVTTMTQLKNIISTQTYNKLQELGMTSEDIVNFITYHMRPKLANIGDGELVRKAIWYREALAAMELLTFNENSSLNKNVRIDNYLRNEFATIINGRGSETFKQAGRSLAAATQNNKLDSFRISEQFASLTTNNNGLNERAIIEALTKKLRDIRDIQNYIGTETQKIETIEVKTEGIKDNQTTLEEDMKDLNEIRTSFTLDEEAIKELGLEVSDFDISSFDTTYTEKRLEILAYAESLGMTQIDGVEDIRTELGKVEAARELLEKQAETERLISKITPVPPDTATAMRMRDWYDENNPHIETLITLMGTINTSETTLIAKINAAIARKSEFVERYEIVRDTAITAIQADIASLTTISTGTPTSPTEFGAKQIVVTSAIRSFNGNMKNLGESYIGFAINWAGLKNLFAGGEQSIYVPFEKNSIVYLENHLKDDLTTTLPEGFSFSNFGSTLFETVRDIEQDLDVNIDTTNLDANNAATVQSYISQLITLDGLLDRGILIFANPDVLANKRQQIQAQVSALEDTFVEALQKAEGIDDIERIKRIYDIHVTGEFLGTWEKIKLSVGIENDRVQDIYEERLNRSQEIREENRRRDYLENIVLTKVNIESYPIIQLMIQRDIVKTYLESLGENDENNTTINGYEFYHLMKSWSTNPELIEYREQINSYIREVESSMESKIQR